MIGEYNEQVPKLFTQGLFEESSVAKQRLGTVRQLDDGRVFAYARAGAAGLNVGELQQQAAPAANHLNIAVATAAAIGDKRVNVTLGATAAAKDLYKDGFMHVNDAGGQGHLYKIRGHAAIGSGGTGYIELYDGIRVALTTSSKVTLTKHIADGVIQMLAAPSGAPAGIPPIAVTALYYFWMQVKGPCSVLTDGTIVIGANVVPSNATPGSVEDFVPGTSLEMVVGTVLQVNATAKHSLIMLAIPGY